LDPLNKATPIKKPDPSPAKNKSATESPAVNPHKIIGILRGKIIPIWEDAAVMAAEYLELYPCLTIAGIIIVPVAEVSATAEPETPPKNILSTTFVAESPPGKNPTIASAKSTNRLVTPPFSMIFPVKIKKIGRAHV